MEENRQENILNAFLSGFCSISCIPVVRQDPVTLQEKYKNHIMSYMVLFFSVLSVKNSPDPSFCCIGPAQYQLLCERCQFILAERNENPVYFTWVVQKSKKERRVKKLERTYLSLSLNLENGTSDQRQSVIVFFVHKIKTLKNLLSIVHHRMLLGFSCGLRTGRFSTFQNPNFLTKSRVKNAPQIFSATCVMSEHARRAAPKARQVSRDTKADNSFAATLQKNFPDYQQVSFGGGVGTVRTINDKHLPKCIEGVFSRKFENQKYNISSNWILATTILFLKC